MEVKLKTRKNKGKNTLFIEYMEGEKRVRSSLHLEDTKSNVAYAYRHIIPEIERKIKAHLKVRVYKISEFIDIAMEYTKETKKYNTIINYQYGIDKFYKIMGDVNVESTRTVDIDKYIKALIKEGLSSATIALYLAPVRLAFKEAIRSDVIDKNPVQYARRPIVKNKEKKPFTLTQMHTILRKAEGNIKTFLYIAFFTGARTGEILALRWKDVKDSKINICRTLARGQFNSPKNGKSRTIATLNPLQDYLDTIQKGKSEERIVGFSYELMDRKFKKILKSLGYEKTSLHVTRHTFTSLLLQAKESPTLVQYFLGHESLNMINRVYAHYIEDEQDTTRLENVLSL